MTRLNQPCNTLDPRRPQCGCCVFFEGSTGDLVELIRQVWRSMGQEQRISRRNLLANLALGLDRRWQIRINEEIACAARIPRDGIASFALV